MKEVIILNKPFLGGWLNGEGKIGHEIIDFFLADNGQHYIYNNPWGVCPSDIWVGDSDINNYGLVRTAKEKYVAKYMVLTSGAHATSGEDESETDLTIKKQNPKTFNIQYVIELKEKIHGKTTGKNLKANQEKIKKLIDKEKIKYNGVPLYDIYQSDESLYLTFKAAKIYEAVEILPFTPKQYNFQRNKGYIKSDDHNDDYIELKNLIENNIGVNLKEMHLNELSESLTSTYSAEKTFLDLIGFTGSEQAFTNLLYTMLQNNEVFKRFCKELKESGAEFAENETFNIEREKKVENGRMDICGVSKSQKVIIENKIYSGLNGLSKENRTSQLSTYYKWACTTDESVKPPIEPLCFIAAPDYRVIEIKKEIEEFDPTMSDKYHIITYSKIANFFNSDDIKNLFNNEENKLIYSLYNQIVSAFRKWSYKSKEELYADMFLKATEESNKSTTRHYY